MVKIKEVPFKKLKDGDKFTWDHEEYVKVIEGKLIYSVNDRNQKTIFGDDQKVEITE